MTAAGYVTQTDRARALGIGRTTVYRVGVGEVAPSANVIARALLVLGCRFEELFEVVESDGPERGAA